MSEVGVARAGGDDEVVVVEHVAVGQPDGAMSGVDGLRFSKEHAHVGRVPEDPAERRGDITRRQRSGRDLVEERLEQVVVVAIEQRDAHRVTAEHLGGHQASEATAENHHMWVRHN
jgi:hypothetical protein